MILSFLRRNKIFLILWLIFIVSIALRTLPLFYQGIWLDEQYSLFFAKNFSWNELLFTFESDVHPGLYYLILKISLNFIRDLIQLRILTSLLPQLLGISLVLYLVERISAENNKKPLIVSALMLGFNPLLILTSWQLRPYNWVILFIAIILVVTHWFLSKKSFFRLFVVFLFSLLANFFYYGIFIFTFLNLSYCIYKINLKNKISFMIVVLFSSFFIMQFFSMAGFQIKHQFEQAAWLPIPTLKNIPSIFLTLSGFKANYFIPSESSVIELLLFYFILFLLLLRSIKFSKKFIKLRENSEWYLLIIAPILFFFTMTFVSLFLSKRLFFHRFTPGLSFLIPRIFIPTVIYFSFYFSLWLENKKLDHKHYLIVITLSILWIVNSLSTSLYAGHSRVQLKKIINSMTVENDENDVIFYPSWYWIHGVGMDSKIEKTKKLIDYSNDFYSSKEMFFLSSKSIYIFNLSVESERMKGDKKIFIRHIKNIGCVNKPVHNKFYLYYSCE